MVWKMLRSLRTLLCVSILGSLLLFLLCLTVCLRQAVPPNDLSLPAQAGSVDESRRWWAELELLRQRESQRQKEFQLDREQDLEQLRQRESQWLKELQLDRELDLEALLRSNEDEDWARGPECAPYPRYEDLVFKSPHFQETRHHNLTYYLFGAYYDSRPRVAEVMVLSMINTWQGPYPETYCQMWFEGETLPELVPLHQTKLGWYPQWGHAPGVAFSTLLTFRMLSPRIPQLVALVFGNRCAVPQNALKVVQPPPRASPHPRRRLRTGVCLKYLRFPDVDMSERLVEWLELMRLLGAGQVRGYDIGQLHPNVSRTLAHYTRPEDGFLELRPYQMLPSVPGLETLCRQQNEVLLYNDCLYRSMYEFDYVAVIDVDEVIMPLGRLRNWPDLLEELEAADDNCTARCSYCFRNVYFPKELPPDPRTPPCFHMLAHVTRVAEHLHWSLAAKCLHNTAYATVMHNHFPIQCRDSCGPSHVEVAYGQLQHYRRVDQPKTLREPPPKLDDNIRRFQQQLVRNVLEVQRQLGWRGAA